MLDAKKEKLSLPADRKGMVVYQEHRRTAPSPHRHDELEVNLVVRGSATYLLGDRRYDLGEGTLAWLFPEQDHVLVDRSAGFAMWWAVFSTGLLQRWCTPPETMGLLDRDPMGNLSRRLDSRRVRRIKRLFA